MSVDVDVSNMGWYFGRWRGHDKIGDSLTISLTIPKKPHSDVPVFAPANHRDFYRQGVNSIGSGLAIKLRATSGVIA